MLNSRSVHKESSDHGVAALEFVFVLPFLIALLLAIVQFGLFFSTRVDITSAARDAARTLALRGAPTYPAGMTPVPGSVVTCPAGNTTANASVTLTTTYTFSIPGIPLGARTVTATGTMRCGG